MSAGRPRRIAFPPESRLYPRLAEATYHDAFEAGLSDAALTPVEIFRRMARRTSGWVHGMMGLRDAVVRPLGLRTGGRLDHSTDGAPAVGDQFSIFQVLASDADELVMGIDDSHLDVRISVLVRRSGRVATYVIGSWVKTHNALGRLYMLPVAPFHRLIVVQGMRAVAV